MKANELMIGDWVLQCELNVPVKVQSIMRHYDENIYFYHETSEYISNVSKLDPIPLTHEILEKNNDILYGELPILFDDGKMHYSIVECRYVSKEYEQNGETFYCLLSSCAYNGGSFVTPFAKIRYIHELQHALKLCGIEKEIIL